MAVLEVGAGLAWMCRAAKAVNPDNVTVAEDISPEAVHKCPWVDFYILGNILDTRMDERAPYDVISLTHVIEHLVDPEEAIRRCNDLLRQHGVIFVTAPHRPIGWRDSETDITVWEKYSYNHVPAHIQYFSKKSMRKLSEKAGCTLDYWSHNSEEGQAFEGMAAVATASRFLRRPSASRGARLNGGTSSTSELEMNNAKDQRSQPSQELSRWA